MTFKVELIKSDGGYTANCPELPGCWTQGGTEEEALVKARSVIAEYLAVTPPEARQKKIVFLDISDHDIPDDLFARERKAARDETQKKPLPDPAIGAKPFKVIPWDMGLPPQWISGKISDLLDLLDGEERPW